MRGCWLSAVLWVLWLPARAGGLPEPLTLEVALRYADAAHPDLVLAAAARGRAEAETWEARSLTGFRSRLRLEARYIEPSAYAFDQSHDDSFARLEFSKRLYDFGRSRALLAAARAAGEGSEFGYLNARLERRLEIMARFLGVLLDDLDFRVKDEAMAMAYVRLDEARNRHELGQMSDVDLLKLETAYQEARGRRYAAASRQRASRVRLAEAMGLPDQVPRTLLPPDGDAHDWSLPELETLMAQVLEESPLLRALRAELERRAQALAAARASGRPVVSAQVELNRYRRTVGSRDPLIAGVVLDVPLSRGGQTQAEVAAAHAAYQEAQARLALAERDLRQEVVDLWENVQVLQARRQEARTRLDYRDLYLDRSRALYEMEVETDLGDAMTLSTEAVLEQARLEYQLMLDQARLDALRGISRWAPLDPEEDEVP